MTDNLGKARTSQKTPRIREFPNFSKLTLEHRKEYESIIKKYPPVADISFVTLFQWWDYVGEAQIATMGENLVVLYWNHGGEDYSGLSLIGTEEVDASLCTIFDFLRTRDHPQKVVNVPDFVVHSMQYPEMFNIAPCRREDEYLVGTSQFERIENLPSFKRAKIKRFMRDTSGSKLEIAQLDLKSVRNQQLMIEASNKWPRKGINAIGKLENDVLSKTVQDAWDLELHNICIFINDTLQAFCFYHATHDRSHVIIDHGRVNYEIPGLFDYMVYAFSRNFAKQGIEYVNLHGDLDVLKMRIIKLALRPANFFRKYTIQPADISA